jgi:hypothetical protein
VNARLEHAVPGDRLIRLYLQSCQHSSDEQVRPGSFVSHVTLRVDLIYRDANVQREWWCDRKEIDGLETAELGAVQSIDIL